MAKKLTGWRKVEVVCRLPLPQAVWAVEFEGNTWICHYGVRAVADFMEDSEFFTRLSSLMSKVQNASKDKALQLIGSFVARYGSLFISPPAFQFPSSPVIKPVFSALLHRFVGYEFSAFLAGLESAGIIKAFVYSPEQIAGLLSPTKLWLGLIDEQPSKTTNAISFLKFDAETVKMIEDKAIVMAESFEKTLTVFKNAGKLLSKWHTEGDAEPFFKALLNVSENPILTLHKDSLAFFFPTSITAFTFRAINSYLHGLSPRKCQGCGALFIPSRSNQKHCSPTCRANVSRKKGGP